MGGCDWVEGYVSRTKWDGGRDAAPPLRRVGAFQDVRGPAHWLMPRDLLLLLPSLPSSPPRIGLDIAERDWWAAKLSSRHVFVESLIGPQPR